MTYLWNLEAGESGKAEACLVLLGFVLLGQDLVGTCDNPGIDVCDMRRAPMTSRNLLRFARSVRVR